jgi:hypothetical protein
MASTRGRSVVIPLTNKSGGQVIAGDVVIIDTGNNLAFTTTTSAGVTGGIGIAQETIASNAVGRVLIEGYAALVNVNASVTRGNFGKTHTVAKQATDAGSSRTVGTFCQFLTGGTTPDARVYPPDLNASSGNVATDTIWDAAGDLAVGSGADTAARLAIGNAGAVLARINGAVAWNAGTSFPSAATGDRYFRTDLGLEFYYDGTRWVTTQLFRDYIGNVAISATGTQTYRIPTWATDQSFTLWVDAFLAATNVATTSDGSNKYVITLRKLDTANSPTTIGTIDTGSDTHDVWTPHRNAIGAALDPATSPALRIDATKTGSPGSCTFAGAWTYRLVHA